MEKLVAIRILSLCLLFAAGTLTGQARFTDITESAGLVHEYRVFEGLFGGGACVLDFDGDGYEDLYLTGGLDDDQLLRNNGDGTFTNIFTGSGLEPTRGFVTQGAVTADMNRDGFPDLFVTTITSRDSLQIIPRARNLLFLGQADHTFRDATEEYGLRDLYSFSTGASVGDFDNDAWPDLYVGNYFIGYEAELSTISDATIVGANQTAPGYLLHNEGGERFRDVYADYGLNFRGFGFGGVFTDYDNDGDQDLLVNHDFGYKATPDLLLENRYPREKFVDEAKAMGMDLRINSMSAAVGDYNEDGQLDYYVTNIKLNRFMVAQPGGGPFRDLSQELGTRLISISWGANFADFDQDGDLDLFVSNGDLNPPAKPMGNFYFENLGGRFEERARLVGLADFGIGRGSVVFDMDRDGDLDILAVCQAVVAGAYPVPSVTRLYRNDGPTGNWLQVRLEGKEAERSGLGSRVTVHSGGHRLIREVDGGSSSHLSQSSRLLHFGLGGQTVVDSILVTWNGGQEQILLNQAVNQVLTIRQLPDERLPVFIWWIAGGVLATGLLAFFAVRRQRRLRRE